MIQVNQNTRINWQYVDQTTICRIFNTETKQVVFEASVKKYKNDTFNKDKARKASLAKVLKNISREERSSYWNAYRVSKTTPRW